MKEPVQYASGCGCVQYESGTVERCQRHITADWQAAQALIIHPVDTTWRAA